MTRYKATISYDGYAFAGFQRQTHARSVQEEIEKTLTRLNKGKAITVHGAGRTDSCLLYTSPSPRDKRQSRMPSSA